MTDQTDLNWNLHHWAQHKSMIDAILCQNYSGNLKMIQMLRKKWEKTRRLTDLYSFVKCDMFLRYVQDLMKQLCIFDMQVF